MNYPGLIVSSLVFLGMGCGSKHTVDPMALEVPESGTVTSETGLIKQVLECPAGSDLVASTQRCTVADGTLPTPGATTSVTVHYTGWTTDGAEFDSSVRRGEAASFPLDKVIPGWTEGLQTMVAGEKARLWIPEDLAYGGREGAPAGMLIFDVELISF